MLFKTWILTKSYIIFNFGLVLTHYNCNCILVLTALKMGKAIVEKISIYFLNISKVSYWKQKFSIPKKLYICKNLLFKLVKKRICPNRPPRCLGCIPKVPAQSPYASSHSTLKLGLQLLYPACPIICTTISDFRWYCQSLLYTFPDDITKYLVWWGKMYFQQRIKAHFSPS